MSGDCPLLARLLDGCATGAEREATVERALREAGEDAERLEAAEAALELLACGDELDPDSLAAALGAYDQVRVAQGDAAVFA